MQIALRPSPRQLSLGRARSAGRLGAEEERALLARAKQGDRGARDELVERMLPVVVAVARRYRRAGALIDDLIQEGVLGLYQAISHFEPSRSNRFVTYAIWWVRAYVKRHFDVHRSQVRGNAISRRSDVSLDAPFGDEQELSGLERLADLEPSAEAALMDLERAEQLRGSLEQAKARIGDIGWDVLHARTMSPEPETLDGLGERHGVSREWIRIQEKRTLAFLKRYLAEWEAP
ncbi:MAG: sigma-70 family RNA polymerase sigma factor [Deltaproteobacteria bacterium]|nr:sigma-70 family RNA polymerase sigma factor [Deltaproteobacteria bacterium]